MAIYSLTGRATGMAEQKKLDYERQSSYSGGVCRHRLSKGDALFRRTRYQHGSVEREERRKGPSVWVYRWWEEDINGKLVHRKVQVGDVKKYPTESAAHAAADALRLTINNRCDHRNLRRTTINTLLGALLSRGTASQSFIQTGRTHNVREKL